MLTSWSEVSTPAELSMKSVLTSPPARAYSILAAWVRPRLPPSADHLGAQPRGVDADGVVGPVTGVGVRLGARLDVGADAAVPEQAHRRRQDGRDELIGRERVHGVVQARGPARACGDTGTDLAARGHTPPPGEISSVL